MKRAIICFILLCFGVSNAQEMVSKTRIKKFKLPVNNSSLIYLKKTGKRITYSEYRDLKKVNPSLVITSKEEDINGYPISFIVEESFESIEKKPLAIGDTIPFIKRKDINNEILNLPKLNSKKKLIILQLDLELPMINTNQIQLAESFVLSNNNFLSIILTSSSVNQSKRFSLEHKFKSSIIPNAHWIIQRFHFKRFPIFLIVDEMNVIIEKMNYADDIENVMKKY